MPWYQRLQPMPLRRRSFLTSAALQARPGRRGDRAQEALRLRLRMAREALADVYRVTHVSNGDETTYPNRIGSYGKGLPHDELGVVDAAAYRTLMAALDSERAEDFEAITLGGGRKLANPRAGLAFELGGADPQGVTQRPAPAFASAEIAAEMAELYWMALLRDVPFQQYANHPVAAAAAADLSRFSDFRGPRENGRVTPGTLFRDASPGSATGPYLSQFLWLAAPFGAEQLDRKMRTTAPGVDHLTTVADWLANQRGATAFRPAQYDPERRYMRNGRDLGEWVHIDVLFQAYLTALLCLPGLGAPLDSGHPYLRSRTQGAFATLGDPWIASLLCAVAKPALEAVWYQKWFVHRRLRPEEYAGRVHFRRTRAANDPVHAEILNSPSVTEIERRFGTALLPQAYPEGSPTHPSYGSGHAVVAGACTTILKALYDESWVIPRPVEVSADGLSLTAYQGPPLTLGGELNKLAANVAHGRNIAGVHWRSDAVDSLALGEEVAIRLLRQERACVPEDFGGFSLTRFDGAVVTI